MTDNQSERLPDSYNQDERLRKIEQEKQLQSFERKIDDLILTVKGDERGAVVGFSNRLLKVEHEMWGTEEHMGIATKVQLVWRSWIWFACTASAIAGGGITQLVRWLWKI